MVDEFLLGYSFGVLLLGMGVIAVFAIVLAKEYGTFERFLREKKKTQEYADWKHDEKLHKVMRE